MTSKHLCFIEIPKLVVVEAQVFFQILNMVNITCLASSYTPLICPIIMLTCVFSTLQWNVIPSFHSIFFSNTPFSLPEHSQLVLPPIHSIFTFCSTLLITVNSQFIHVLSFTYSTFYLLHQMDLELQDKLINPYTNHQIGPSHSK